MDTPVRGRRLAALGLVHTDPQWGMACRVIGGVPYPGFITVDAVESLQSEFVAAPGDVFVTASVQRQSEFLL